MFCHKKPDHRYAAVIGVLVFILCGGCASVHRGRFLTAQDSAAAVNGAILDRDIVPVQENMVLFLSITETEYQKREADPRSNIFKTMDDFYGAMGHTLEEIKKQGIGVAVSASRKFKFIYKDGREEYFERLGDDVGIAYFGKGNKPRIEYGAKEAVYIMQALKEYFAAP
jgi:hypothetical protein